MSARVTLTKKKNDRWYIGLPEPVMAELVELARSVQQPNRVLAPLISKLAAWDPKKERQ
jgi:hypothetical protein